MGVTYSQFSPSAPTLTEHNLPRQDGKVFIVIEGGKVYIAGRSVEKANAAIKRITTSNSTREVHFLHVASDDLASIKAGVEEFKSRESKLNVLFNNAGVSLPPQGSVSAQGLELTTATNCVGHYLLTELLLLVLRDVDGGSRVVWTSSIADQLQVKSSPDLTEFTTAHPEQQRNYANSKLGNWLLATDLSPREKENAILSVSQNPGNLKTSLLRHMPAIVGYVVAPLLYPAKYGAYTELYCGLSQELTLADGGCYVMPWGRKHPSPRNDLLYAMSPGDVGGAYLTKRFTEWCQLMVKDYM